MVDGRDLTIWQGWVDAGRRLPPLEDALRAERERERERPSWPRPVPEPNVCEVLLEVARQLRAQAGRLQSLGFNKGYPAYLENLAGQLENETRE